MLTIDNLFDNALEVVKRIDEKEYNAIIRALKEISEMSYYYEVDRQATVYQYLLENQTVLYKALLCIVITTKSFNDKFNQGETK
jgi:hypothetical protein